MIQRPHLSIMPLEVEVHALPESLLAQQCVVHADHLSSLLIHGHSVEVVHLDVAVRADGVSHGAGILTELTGTQDRNILDKEA